MSKKIYEKFGIKLYSYNNKFKVIYNDKQTVINDHLTCQLIQDLLLQLGSSELNNNILKRKITGTPV